jgi:Ras-related protein Rab-5C
MFSNNEIIAKKIPIEHILASTRGGTGRPGASRPGTTQEGGVNLDENAAKGKDACNC